MARVTDGVGTTLTAGTMAGAMVIILTDMDTTLMVTDTILTAGTMAGVGTTAGITTILGRLLAIVALAQGQPLRVQRLERTTAIADLLNTLRLEVRV